MQVILITGAAHGIGRSLSLKLWEQLHHVTLILIDIDEKGLHAVVSSLPNAKNHDVRVYPCDLGNEAAVQACCHKILQDVASLSITAVINNAGIVIGRRFQTLTPCQIRRIFDVNVYSQFWLLQCILPSLKMSKVAHIVTIASVLGMVPSAGLVDYCATKAALIAFHNSLRLELRQNDTIRMLLVCPMGVNTGMFAGAFEGDTISKKLTLFISPLLHVTKVAHRIIEAMSAGDDILISCADGWRGLIYPYILYLVRCFPVSVFDYIIAQAVSTLSGRILWAFIYIFYAHQMPPIRFVALLTVYSIASSKIHPNVYRQLEEHGVSKVIITFKSGIRPVMQSLSQQAALQSAHSTSREAKIQNVVQRLRTHAIARQRKVKVLLNENINPITLSTANVSETSLLQSFWLTNQLAFHADSIDILHRIATIANVIEIRPERIIPMNKPVASKPYQSANDSLKAWGIKRITAEKAWNLGVTGQNIVVGSIDTGVRATHTALSNSYRAEYGWMDAVNGLKDPYDDLGHGTHTVGTMVGIGIGVAPGAQWIACKACTPTDCSESALLACAQFMTCPTSSNSQSFNCSKAPHIINNSWGGSLSSDFMENIIRVWLNADIFPIFANGNYGPACESTVAPGDFKNVISVGAITLDDSVGWYSGKGPSTLLTGSNSEDGYSHIKPDVSAPGDDIYSALPFADDAYGTQTGTSMAAPHVAGVAALALSANPSLTSAQLFELLRTSVTTDDLKRSGYDCGAISESQYPNNAVGHGLINAVLAVNTARKQVLKSVLKPVSNISSQHLKQSNSSEFEEFIPVSLCAVRAFGRGVLPLIVLSCGLLA
uniref:subtilisin n=1 Tax=Albugo laibachii Nc14 TaxID=890382 RepID=F0W773_9STRA|nr:serine protease family S08A putative [Albugo laibachii Nc14]|eukprot:CCA16972.1 serine protease family S08A putative [Albugo laibachii Nc14]